MKENQNIQDDSLGFLIGRTFRTMSNKMNKLLADNEMDLTSEMAIALKRIHGKDGVSQQELADMIFRDKSTTKRLIDNMEKRHLVVRIADKKDKRNKLIYLTKTGKDKHSKIISMLKVIRAQSCEEIDLDELMIFKKVINKLYENIQRIE